MWNLVTGHSASGKQGDKIISISKYVIHYHQHQQLISLHCWNLCSNRYHSPFPCSSSFQSWCKPSICLKSIIHFSEVSLISLTSRFSLLFRAAYQFGCWLSFFLYACSLYDWLFYKVVSYVFIGSLIVIDELMRRKTFDSFLSK